VLSLFVDDVEIGIFILQNARNEIEETISKMHCTIVACQRSASSVGALW